MSDFFKFFGEFFLTVLIVSAVLLSIKNERTRNALASVAALFGLLWLLLVLIVLALARGTVAVYVAVFLLLCLLMFLIHFWRKASNGNRAKSSVK
jgi:uncharacterized membrane protein